MDFGSGHGGFETEATHTPEMSKARWMTSPSTSLSPGATPWPLVLAGMAPKPSGVDSVDQEIHGPESTLSGQHPSLIQELLMSPRVPAQLPSKRRCHQEEAGQDSLVIKERRECPTLSATDDTWCSPGCRQWGERVATHQVSLNPATLSHRELPTGKSSTYVPSGAKPPRVPSGPGSSSR